ncbi:hypothetical protein ACQPWR_21780 [Micromonospora vinacea]
MGCENDGCSHEWHYAPYRTGLGATRYDNLAVRYQATFNIAAINEWL